MDIPESAEAELAESLFNVTSRLERVLSSIDEEDSHTQGIRVVVEDMKDVGEWGPYFARHMETIEGLCKQDPDKSLSEVLTEVDSKVVPSGHASRRVVKGVNGRNFISVNANRVDVGDNPYRVTIDNVEVDEPRANNVVSGGDKHTLMRPDDRAIRIDSETGGVYLSEPVYNDVLEAFLASAPAA